MSAWASRDQSGGGWSPKPGKGLGESQYLLAGAETTGLETHPVGKPQTRSQRKRPLISQPQRDLLWRVGGVSEE
jgi:hypothetical protein